MQIELKDTFEIVEEGTRYRLPQYDVVDGQGIVEADGAYTTIEFVRGSRLADEQVERRRGTLHEHLLGMMIHDLKYKSSLVPSPETAQAIAKLQEAQSWLLTRQIDRQRKGTLGTYQKE